MSSSPEFINAFPYQQDVLALPVTDLDAASSWYCHNFEMTEVERSQHDAPRVILERNGIRIGFAINGGDASQDGAAIQVKNLRTLHNQLKSKGVNVSELSVDQRDEQKFDVFFVVAPDGLCYYFHELIEE